MKKHKANSFEYHEWEPKIYELQQRVFFFFFFFFLIMLTKFIIISQFSKLKMSADKF